MKEAGTRRAPGAVGPWADRAACKGRTDVFFPAGESGSNALDEGVYAAAKAICDGCPVRVECDDFATRTRQHYGVWGGRDRGQRRRTTAS